MHSTWENNNDDLFIMLLFYILPPEHPHTTMSTDYVDVGVFVAIRITRGASMGETITNMEVKVFSDTNQQTKQLDDWDRIPDGSIRAFKEITVRVPLSQAKVVTEKTTNLDEYLKNISE